MLDTTPIWDSFPAHSRTPDDDLRETLKALENRPAAVFGELGRVLACIVGFALAVNVALAAFGIR